MAGELHDNGYVVLSFNHRANAQPIFMEVMPMEKVSTTQNAIENKIIFNNASKNDFLVS